MTGSSDKQLLPAFFGAVSHTSETFQQEIALKVYVYVLYVCRYNDMYVYIYIYVCTYTCTVYIYILWTAAQNRIAFEALQKESIL